MFFARGNKRGTSSSGTSTESGNSPCRRFSTSPSSRAKYDFSIEPFRVSHIGTASIFSSKLGEANKQFVYKHSSRVSNSIPEKTIVGSVFPCHSNEFETKNIKSEKVDQEIQEILKKAAIESVHSSHKQFLSQILG